jgi:hypothetical protein
MGGSVQQRAAAHVLTMVVLAVGNTATERVQSHKGEKMKFAIFALVACALFPRQHRNMP